VLGWQGIAKNRIALLVEHWVMADAHGVAAIGFRRATKFRQWFAMDYFSAGF
jgi:hypothetical protein